MSDPVIEAAVKHIAKEAAELNEAPAFSADYVRSWQHAVDMQKFLTPVELINIATRLLFTAIHDGDPNHKLIRMVTGPTLKIGEALKIHDKEHPISLY